MVCNFFFTFNLSFDLLPDVSDHATALLVNPLWLPSVQRIKAKLMNLVLSRLQNVALPYPSNCMPCYIPRSFHIPGYLHFLDFLHVHFLSLHSQLHSLTDCISTGPSTSSSRASPSRKLSRVFPVLNLNQPLLAGVSESLITPSE